MPCKTAPLRPCLGSLRTSSRTGNCFASSAQTAGVWSWLLSSTIRISNPLPPSAAAIWGTSSGKFADSFNVGTITETSISVSAVVSAEFASSTTGPTMLTDRTDCISFGHCTNYPPGLHPHFNEGTVPMAEKSVSTDSLGIEKKHVYSGKKIRMAFIGCGGIGQTHLGVLKNFPDVEVVAAVDV